MDTNDLTVEQSKIIKTKVIYVLFATLSLAICLCGFLTTGLNTLMLVGVAMIMSAIGNYVQGGWTRYFAILPALCAILIIIRIIQTL